LSLYGELEVFAILYSKQIDYEIKDNVKIIDLKEKTDVTHIISRICSLIRKIIKMKREVRSNNIDTIISIMPSMNIVSLMAKTGCALIITEHNVINKSNSISSLVINILRKVTYRKADKIVCVSQGVSHSLSSNISKLDIDVIYNPIDLQEIRQKAQDEISCKYGEYILGVGRLHEQKGFDLLIKAFSRIDKDIDLVILGEGSEKNNLEDIAKEEKVLDRVHILKFQNNPYKYMKNAKAFILSSRWEGFGMVLAEALVVNERVVSFDCMSGPSEILQNGKLGILVEPNNVKKLSEAIDYAVGDKPITTRGEIDKQLQKFDIKQVVKQYYNLIR